MTINTQWWHPPSLTKEVQDQMFRARDHKKQAKKYLTGKLLSPFRDEEMMQLIGNDEELVVEREELEVNVMKFIKNTRKHSEEIDRYFFNSTLEKLIAAAKRAHEFDKENSNIASFVFTGRFICVEETQMNDKVKENEENKVQINKSSEIRF